MDHIIAKVKGKSKKSLFKLISDKTLFPTISVNLANCILYSPDHNLDEDSWFKIESFSSLEYCLEYLKDPIDSKDLDELQKGQFDKISYVFCIQDKDFYFQKVTPSLFIHKKMIVFGEVAEIESNNNRLVINEIPDAIYFKDADTLIFKSLITISSIFKGIDILYKEATSQEVDGFLRSPFISIKGSYGVDVVSKPNRKRIALVLNTLSKMSAQDKIDMHTYINEYCEDKLKFEESSSKYEISNDDELKYLLYGIEQRFYTTPFSKEKRLANSIIAMT